LIEENHLSVSVNAGSGIEERKLFLLLIALQLVMVVLLAAIAFSPWSVSYALETNIVENPDEDRSHYNKDQAKINFVPRIGKGMWSILSRLFLFETKGQKVHDKQLEKTMIITYDNQEPALRFIKYPGVSEILMTLHDDCHLKEMVVKTDEGIYFNQGVNFKDMDMDLCQATFKYMGELSQVLAEAF
jgi:hypothetical protein